MSFVSWLFRRYAHTSPDPTFQVVNITLSCASFDWTPPTDLPLASKDKEQMRQDINAALADWLMQRAFDLEWTPRKGVTWVATKPASEIHSGATS